MMKYILLWLLLIVLQPSYAEEIFPKGCRAMVVKDERVTLSAEKLPQLVFLHNLSAEDLWITHPVTDPSASAGWSSRLQAGNWSALVLGNSSFELSCVESKPGHEQQIPCAGVLAICQWKSIKISAEKKDTYWAAEDMALPSLKAHVGGQGFRLPASS
jgi:hypothetical protein